MDYKLLDYYTQEIIFVSRPYAGDDNDCEWKLSCSGSAPDSDVVRFKG